MKRDGKPNQTIGTAAGFPVDLVASAEEQSTWSAALVPPSRMGHDFSLVLACVSFNGEVWLIPRSKMVTTNQSFLLTSGKLLTPDKMAFLTNLNKESKPKSCTMDTSMHFTRILVCQRPGPATARK